MQDAGVRIQGLAVSLLYSAILMAIVRRAKRAWSPILAAAPSQAVSPLAVSYFVAILAISRRDAKS
jgi:hypothetical protein